MQRFEYETVDSTNEVAKRLIADGSIASVAVVVAREQTGGKGTQGRSWVSPRDAGLYLSIVDPNPEARGENIALLTLAAAVACARTLTESCGIIVRIKPINDLFCSDRKLGGILTEGTAVGAIPTAVITGIGINTHHVHREMPPDSVRPVSMQELLPPQAFAGTDFRELVSSLVAAVQEWQAQVARDGWNAIERVWADYAVRGARLTRR